MNRQMHLSCGLSALVMQGTRERSGLFLRQGTRTRKCGPGRRFPEGLLPSCQALIFRSELFSQTGFCVFLQEMDGVTVAASYLEECGLLTSDISSILDGGIPGNANQRPQLTQFIVFAIFQLYQSNQWCGFLSSDSMFLKKKKLSLVCYLAHVDAGTAVCPCMTAVDGCKAANAAYELAKRTPAFSTILCAPTHATLPDVILSWMQSSRHYELLFRSL